MQNAKGVSNSNVIRSIMNFIKLVKTLYILNPYKKNFKNELKIEGSLLCFTTKLREHSSK